MVEKRTVQSVSAAQARRIALAAQGFGRPQPASIGIRQLDAALHRLQVLQLDSVNVFERSHYLPLFARLGGYDKAQLDRLTFGRKARYTEYWAHVAALIPLEDWPLWRWKMAAHKAKWEADANSWVSTHATFLDWLRAELREKGPLSASQVEHETAGKRRGGWWEWSDVKIGLEYLFYMGDAVAAGRTRFERTYGVPEHVIPAELREIDIDEATAYRTLLLKAAQAHGIGTVGDLADYFRLYKIPAAKILRDLAAEGELVPVTVEGWNSGTRPLPAYLHPSARIPRRVDAAALLSPFDPVVWERDRALRMFGFHYRIEIYTPAPKRLFGYYTLPVLVDDRIVARIDLKSDRQAGVLRVQSAWHEDGQPRGYEARIAQLLRDTAAWQGLGGLEVRNWGDLAPAMAAELDVALLPRATEAETAQPEDVLAGD